MCSSVYMRARCQMTQSEVIIGETVNIPPHFSVLKRKGDQWTLKYLREEYKLVA